MNDKAKASLRFPIKKKDNQKVNRSKRIIHTLITRSLIEIFFPPEASCNELSWLRNLQEVAIQFL